MNFQEEGVTRDLLRRENATTPVEAIEERHSETPISAKDLLYWKNKFAGKLSKLDLPLDRPGSATSAVTRTGSAATFSLPANMCAALQKVASAEGAEVSFLLLSAFIGLLYRYTGQEDFAVVISGFTRIGEGQGSSDLLPLRSSISAEQTFLQLLGQVQQEVEEAAEHAIPCRTLLGELDAETAKVLVQVGFQLTEDLDSQVMQEELSGAELLFSVQENENAICSRVDFNAELLSPETIERLIGHLQQCLGSVAANPHEVVGRLAILTESERDKLLREWNATATEFPQNSCIHELFEEQARKSPDAIAVVYRDQSLTYRELNERSDLLARHLRKLGVGPEVCVGIFMLRSLEMVVSMYAVLKAGGAYLPLDPAFPAERLAFMMEDSGSPLVLTQQALEARAPRGNAHVLCVDGPEVLNVDGVTTRDVATTDERTTPDNLAYVIYTSGSTGKPKGVMVRHRNVVNLITGMDNVLGGEKGTWLATTSISFDISVVELIWTLTRGSKVVIREDEVRTLQKLFPGASPSHRPEGYTVAELIRRCGVTHVQYTPSVAGMMLDDTQTADALRQVKVFLFGGEPLPPSLVERLSGYREIFNLYGPTETTVWSTFHPVSQSNGRICIGRPIANTQIYILDRHLQPVPVGVRGELFIGGAGVARGYLNRPELTQERFIPDPFDGNPASRIYRTGDLARYCEDGSIEFLGRVDHQVKVRGYRIELGEIEAAMRKQPGIKESVVSVWNAGAGDTRLVGYYVTQPGCNPEISELRRGLRSTLPDYMVPSVFTRLESLPLTPNGKVHRKALPAVQAGSQQPSTPGAPRNDTERRLHELWKEVLKVPSLGIHEQFFASGGHSLLAVRLMAMVEKAFGQKLKVSVLFQNQTIAELAAVLRGEAEAAGRSSVVPIQPDGSKPPLWLVHGAGGGMFWGYGNLARSLGNQQPVFAFKSRGLDGEEELDTIEELAEAYLADLQAFQPQGPYCLGGYCFGGVVAYEMALRLHEQGAHVSFLGLINANAPNSSYDEFRWTPYTALQFARSLGLRAYYYARAHPERIGQFLRWKAGALGKRLLRRFESPGMEKFSADDLVDLSQMSHTERAVWQKHLLALRNYHPRPYPGTITLFRSPVHALRCSFEPDYGWKNFALGGVTQVVIPSTHEMIMEEPMVRTLAAAFRKCLAEAPRTQNSA